MMNTSATHARSSSSVERMLKLLLRIDFLRIAQPTGGGDQLHGDASPTSLPRSTEAAVPRPRQGGHAADASCSPVKLRPFAGRRTDRSAAYSTFSGSRLTILRDISPSLSPGI